MDAYWQRGSVSGSSGTMCCGGRGQARNARHRESKGYLGAQMLPLLPQQRHCVSESAVLCRAELPGSNELKMARRATKGMRLTNKVTLTRLFAVRHSDDRRDLTAIMCLGWHRVPVYARPGRT